MDRLSPLDAEFVEAENEDPRVSMAIGSIAVFGGRAPRFDEFLSAIEQRLPLVPRYRQKLRTIPFRIGPPVWVDDPHFDIRYHVRRTALPKPGGDAELAQLMGWVMSQRLDRDRPLWEYWMVTGLRGGHWAVISKVHHSMVDGVSGTDLYRVIFGPAPEEEELAEKPGAREPSTLELVARATGDNLLLPVRRAGAAMKNLSRPLPALGELVALGRGAWTIGTAVSPAPPSSLTGPIGQPRRYTWVRVPLDDIRAVKAGLGGTVNDVVLAAITAGFRTLLLARGETPHAHTLPSLVPVSLRAPGEERIYDNRVSAMIVHLPVHLSDPTEQLATIRQELGILKESGQAAVGAAAASLATYLPYYLTSAARWGYRIPQRNLVTVTTNVPGPRQQLYCLGRPLVEILPYVPLASTLRIGVAIFSYCDQITFGITGDYDTTPDLEVLAQGIADGVAALVKTIPGRT
jgi:WS/DGAT/MGAT family acyltransferase